MSVNPTAVTQQIDAKSQQDIKQTQATSNNASPVSSGSPLILDLTSILPSGANSPFELSPKPSHKAAHEEIIATQLELSNRAAELEMARMMRRIIELEKLLEAEQTKKISEGNKIAIVVSENENIEELKKKLGVITAAFSALEEKYKKEQTEHEKSKANLTHAQHLLSSAVAARESEYERGCNAGKAIGRAEGHNSGYQIGHAAGYAAGYAAFKRETESYLGM
jgi:hypothetical protein